MKRFWLSALIGAALTGLTGCGNSTNPPPAMAKGATNAAAEAAVDPRIPTKAQGRLQAMKLWIGPKPMTAELALNDLQRQTGMMFRTNMAENDGMLFVFPVPHQTAFWMMNTFLPLSAAYIDPNGVILEIHDLQPHDTNSVEAATDRVQYVLETPQGWFRNNGITVGTVISTEAGPLNKVFTRQQ